MNIYRLKNVCRCQKFFPAFRSAHTATKSDSGIEVLSKQDPKLTQSPAGITVASIENYSPVSQISIVLKAGSRYENPQNLGIVHCLRNCATLASKNHSAFFITRNLELKGSKLVVSSTREHITYTLQCARDEIHSGLELLAEVCTKPAFKRWEVNDSTYRIKLDLALLDTNIEAVLMEALHKASFRGGLSNSLYCPSFMIGKHSSEDLHNFVNENFAASRTSVVGLGVNHDYLETGVEKLFNFSNSTGSDGTSKFGGGEVRLERDIPFVHTAIVAEGAGLQNMKDALSLGVLQCLLGSGGHTKHGGTAFSKLGIAATKSTNLPFTVSSMNINYADTGLFGVYICGAPENMKELVKSVVTQMREVTKSFTDSDVQNAKHQLKAQMRFRREKSEDLLSEMAIDTTCFGKIREIKDIEKSIDELNTSDISAVAARVMKTKPAMASVGRLHSTPYIDELI